MNALTPARDFSPATAGEIMENLLIKGDLSRLTPEERAQYYNAICLSAGLNPLTKPFDYIVLNNRLTLYALKACTDQLRQNYGVSITIVSRDLIDGLFVVHVKACDKHGREDEDLGVLHMAYPLRYKDRNGNWNDHPKGGKPLEGEDRANAIMKGVTKAKRRVTLSICGLGMLDETEVEDIPASAKREAQEAVAVEPPPSTGTTAPATLESETVAAPKKPGRKRKDPNLEIDPRFEAEIHASEPRRAFPRLAPSDPDAERLAWEEEAKQQDFIRMEHEIQCAPSIAALERWAADNHAQIAVFSVGERNGLRTAYANKKASLAPHSLSQKAIAARGPRYARQEMLPMSDGLDVPGFLRRT